MAKTYDPIRDTFKHGDVTEPTALETRKYGDKMTNMLRVPVPAPPIEFPAEFATKTIACSKCGREISVGSRVVMAFCAPCSTGMGVKK
jgi:hypothetical protein